MTVVNVFSVPLVDRPSRDLNIQKQLLLSRSANNEPESIAKPMAMGATSIESRIGAMMPAAVIAATETELIARCSTAATNHARRMLNTTGAGVGREQAVQGAVQSSCLDHRPQRTADTGDEQDLAGHVEALFHGVVDSFVTGRRARQPVGAQQSHEKSDVGGADDGIGELGQIGETCSRSTVSSAVLVK